MAGLWLTGNSPAPISDSHDIPNCQRDVVLQMLLQIQLGYYAHARRDRFLTAPHLPDDCTFCPKELRTGDKYIR